jgi:hypothetical protein
MPPKLKQATADHLQASHAGRAQCPWHSVVFTFGMRTHTALSPLVAPEHHLGRKPRPSLVMVSPLTSSVSMLLVKLVVTVNAWDDLIYINTKYSPLFLDFAKQLL